LNRLSESEPLELQTGYPFDPNAVIAVAFKAAGPRFRDPAAPLSPSTPRTDRKARSPGRRRRTLRSNSRQNAIAAVSIFPDALGSSPLMPLPRAPYYRAGSPRTSNGAEPHVAGQACRTSGSERVGHFRTADAHDVRRDVCSSEWQAVMNPERPRDSRVRNYLFTTSRVPRLHAQAPLHARRSRRWSRHHQEASTTPAHRRASRSSNDRVMHAKRRDAFALEGPAGLS
jgi:hypothetical protein